jgi:GNAT superfamily N-acetyltransferase
MTIRLRQGSPTDAPTLMHIEHSCRAAAGFLQAKLRDPGYIRPRQWRAWVTCDPPFDRNPTKRLIYVAYEHSDILGFIACMHDSLFAGYRADIAGLYVLPRYRRQGIGGMLLVAAARWLQEDGIARVTADCYAKDPTRSFFSRLGAFVIASTSDEDDPTAVITFGFPNLKELAAH